MVTIRLLSRATSALDLSLQADEAPAKDSELPLHERLQAIGAVRSRSAYCYLVNALKISLGASVTVLRLKEPFELPGVLCGEDAGEFVLRERAALEADAALLAGKAKDEVEAAAGAILARARESLRQQLPRQSVDLSAGGYFGIGGVAASAGATASLSIDAVALLDSLERGKATGRLILQAHLYAEIAVKPAGLPAQQAQMQLRVSVTDSDIADAAIGLVAAVELPAFNPNLPRLRLDLPRLMFPSLSLRGFSLGPLRQLLDLRLPMPRLPSFVPPLRLNWTEAPPTLEIGDDDTLSLAFDATGNVGTIELNDGTGWQPFAKVENLRFALQGDYYMLAGVLTASGLVAHSTRLQLSGVYGEEGPLPFVFEMDDIAVSATLDGQYDLADPATATLNLGVTFSLPRLLIRAKEDPRLVLALAASWEVRADNGGAHGGRLTRLEIIEPYPVALICAAADAAIDGLVRLIAILKLPGKPDLPGLPLPDMQPVLQRIGQLLAAALTWIAKRAADVLGSAARLLAGVAESALRMLGSILELLGHAASTVLSHVTIEVRLDADSYTLRQLLITPLRKGTDTPPNKAANEPLRFAGLNLSLPDAWSPSLLLDFSEPFFAALLVDPQAATGAIDDDTGRLLLSTDLWLARENQPTEAVRATDENGAPLDEPVLKLRAWKKSNNPLVLIAFDNGRLRFLQAFDNAAELAAEPLQVGLALPFALSMLELSERPRLRDLSESDIASDIAINKTNARRLLPFLGSPKPPAESGGNSLIDQLGQYVELKTATGSVDGSSAKLILGMEVHLGSLDTTVDLQVMLDLSTLAATLEGDDNLDKLVIRSEPSSGELFGLRYATKPKPKPEQESADAGSTPPDDGKFNLYSLHLGGGNPRLVLHEDALVELSYPRLGSDGRGLVFKVTSFAVAKGTFDIVAEVVPDIPVTLPGVEMPFRFDAGRLEIKNGEIQAFSLKGSGELPPELVGEAKCTVKLSLGRGGDGNLAVLACDAELDKADDPIVCQTTRFTLTISKLGFAYADFGAGGGYQFYFLVTGVIAFTPVSDEFADSFLKNLRNVRVNLIKAPLARDLRLLMRSIEVQVALDPKVSFNLFNIFAFELRGFGFHPASPAFDGAPALSLSGQVRFMESGDVISAKIDCHSLWIAPPAKGQSLPRVRLDQLAVALSLQGAGTIEATAVTVDGNLPTLYAPGTLPSNVTAHGFLADGRLKLEGWASMSASMGFLELRRKDNGGHRHAFFLYAQLNELSQPIPTPVKEIYLREAGFGFGHRFTLAGLRRADAVTTPNALVQVLDDVSKYQNDLARFSAWEPEAEGNRITLALRAMLSVESKSTNGTLSRQEENLANPLLFDVAAALRSDMTFLMTVRAWPSVNYYTWVNARDRDDISRRPLLRGYLYISAPRRELLARLLSDPTGYIGTTPELPEPLVMAMRAVKWSSTLYIRPGLFHVEYGWPYELELKLGENKDFGLTCQGGMVFRVEDFSLLYGIAFRANGFAEIGGQVGGRSLGASVVARADFSLEGKFIAYVSLQRFQNTLFYGSLSFACSIRFEVRVWLEIDLRFDTIRLEIGFCLHLSLSIALEVAVGPKLLAGRGSARIGVSAFGRTLSLGAGFGFKTEDLAEARARVDRFLSLGLAASVPDPAAGIAPPSAAPSLPQDERADEDARRRGVLADNVMSKPAEENGSVMIEVDDEIAPGAPRFWLILFELAEEAGTYVAQLIPRDMTGDDPQFDVHPHDATFFARPEAGSHYRLSGADADLSALRQLHVPTKPGSAGEERDVTGGITLTPTLDAKVASSGSGYLTLGELLRSAFLWKAFARDLKSGRVEIPEKLPSNSTALNYVVQIAADRISAQRCRHATVEDADTALQQACSDAARLSLLRQQTVAVEEHRSSIIAAIMASAERLAREATVEGGYIRWPKRAELGATLSIDARDFGLTFVLRRAAGHDDTFGGLFTAPGASPGMSAFRISTIDDGKVLGTYDDDKKPVYVPGEDNPGERPVLLYNPPGRGFDRRNPRLDGLSALHSARGLSLDWDLEPAWQRSRSLWDDPEFHLKHYRIERVFIGAQGPVTRVPTLSTTTKAAAPLKPELRGDQIVWLPQRPLAQFVDDFADLPTAWRDALLQRDTSTQAGYAVAAAGWEQLVNAGLVSAGQVTIQYQIMPIDLAGRAGLPAVLEAAISPPKRPNVAIARAEFTVHHERLPGLATKSGEAPAPVHLYLRVEDLLDTLAEDPEQSQRLPLQGAEYRLKVRCERAQPFGLFGADALAAAQQRPGHEDLARDDATDKRFRLQLRWPAVDPNKRRAFQRSQGLSRVVLATDSTKPSGAPWFVIVADDAADFGPAATTSGLDALHKALGLDSAPATSPLGLRLALQRVRHVQWQRDSEQPVDSHSPWLLADILLWVGMPGADVLGRPRPRPIETVVETFENPRLTRYAPLHYEDLAGEAGRLLVRHPTHDASLEQFCGEAPVLKTLRDGDRRVATRLRWNARPARPDGSSADQRNFIAGYDVFEIDMTGVTRPEDQIDTARDVLRVHALDPRLARLLPDHIDDFGKVDAFYPSLTRRMERALPGTRRAAWFSMAESFGVWAQPVMRRSLGLGADEGELAGLFTLGLPDQLEVAWHASSLERLEKLLKSDQPKDLLRPSYLPPTGSEPLIDTLKTTHDARAAFVLRSHGAPEEKELWKAQHLRRLLHGLVLGSGSESELARFATSAMSCAESGVAGWRDALHDLELEFTAYRGTRRIGHATLTVDLDQPKHAFLADVLDALRWDVNGQDCYRRYHAELENDAAGKGKSLTAFLDERPPQRDPYGWALLRRLGLACGLRLYDSTTAEFVPPRQALQRVDEAMRLVLRRYAGVRLGAPWVDVLARSEGLYVVASFDGAAVHDGVESTRDVLDNETLALLQIALRPVAEGLLPTGEPSAQPADTAEPEAAMPAARYWRVAMPPIDTQGKPVRWTHLSIDLKAWEAELPLLLDAVELARGLSAGRVQAIARDYDQADASDAAKVVSRLVGDRVRRQRLEIDLTGLSALAAGQPLGLLRELQAGERLGDAQMQEKLATICQVHGIFLNDGEGGSVSKSFSTRVDQVLRPTAVDDDLPGPDPFERFAPIEADAMDVLCFGRGDIKPVEQLSQRLRDFLWHAERALPDQPLQLNDVGARVALLKRWPDLISRFFEYGPALPVKRDAIAFALATLPRPDPLRLALQVDGTVEVLLVHSDRLARRRRYLVRPFGRYDNLLSAWQAEQDEDSGRPVDALPWVARRSLRHSFEDMSPNRLPQIALAKLPDHAIDIVVPRTEPLAAPVVLSAGRLDVGPKERRDDIQLQRPGRLIEIVVGRHAEEIASEANRATADALQFEHTAFGFWREFAHARWAEELAVTADLPIDLLPRLPGQSPIPPPLSFSSSKSFEEDDEVHHGSNFARKALPSRLVDGWRGVRVLRTQGLPHFYRVHVATFAAAGVVVSDPVAVSIAESGYELRWPWSALTPAPVDATPPPRWQVIRSGSEVRVVLALPLVRYVDGMPAEDCETWYEPAVASTTAYVFDLPDPGVHYEVSTRLVGGDVAIGIGAERLAGDSSPEVEFMALPGAAQMPGKAQYAARQAGWRLRLAQGDSVQVERPPNHSAKQAHWQIAPRFAVGMPTTGAAPIQPPSDVDDLLVDSAQFHLTPALWAHFAQLAALARHRVTLLRPPPISPFHPINWSPLAQAVGLLVSQLEAYVATAPEGLAATAALRKSIGTLHPYTSSTALPGLFGAGVTLSFALVLPACLALTPPTPLVVLSQSADWSLPLSEAELSYRARAGLLRAAGLDPDPVSGNISPFLRYARALFDRLRALEYQNQSDKDSEPFDGIPSVAATIPRPLRTQAGKLAATGTLPAVFELVRSIEMEVVAPADLRDGPALTAFVALLDLLQDSDAVHVGRPGFGLYPALAALGALERDGRGRAVLRLPDAFLRSPAWNVVHAVLTGVNGITLSAPPAPDALLLRMPPDEEELGTLRDLAAIHDAGDFARFATTLAADQLFGPGRRLFVKATKGLLDSLHEPATRVTEIAP